MSIFDYGSDKNVFNAIMFPSFARLIWSLAFCFAILGTTTQFNESMKLLPFLAINVCQLNIFSDVITRFWSSKFFLPLGRTSYVIYILNPLLVLILSLSKESSFNIDYDFGSIIAMGFVCYTFLAAVVFMIIIYYPLENICKLCLNLL